MSDGCDDCRYGDLQPNEGPCGDCEAFYNWEPEFCLKVSDEEPGRGPKPDIYYGLTWAQEKECRKSMKEGVLGTWFERDGVEHE